MKDEHQRLYGHFFDHHELAVLHDMVEGDGSGVDELVGYLFGVAMTPGHIPPGEWMQGMPRGKGRDGTFIVDVLIFTRLLDCLSHLKAKDRLKCPFDPAPSRPDIPVETQVLHIKPWTRGLLQALNLRPHVWTPSLDEDDLFHRDTVREYVVQNISRRVLCGIAEPDEFLGLSSLHSAGTDGHDEEFVTAVVSLLNEAVSVLQKQ